MTTATQYNGGYKLHVNTEIPVDESTFEVSLTMAECGGTDSVHLHTILKAPGPFGHHQVTHQYVFNPFGSGSEFSFRV